MYNLKLNTFGLYVNITIFCIIQETTPLAGSSAGAIVCAVIASGSSMQDALKATKVLAEDCRLKGTAFRLGVRIYPIPDISFFKNWNLPCIKILVSFV